MLHRCQVEQSGRGFPTVPCIPFSMVAWGFLLVFYSNHSSNTRCFDLMAWDG